MAGEIDDVTLHEAGFLHVLFVHEKDAPAVVNSTVPIVQAVDRRVELIVTPEARQEVLAGGDLDAGEGMRDEICLPVRRIEPPLVARWIREIECALPDAVVIRSETGDHRL